MITLYTKTNCKYCDQAKEYLNFLDIDYKIIEIDKDSKSRDFILNEGHRTVPQIYKDGKLCIEGGYSGLILIDPEKLKNL